MRPFVAAAPAFQCPSGGRQGTYRQDCDRGRQPRHDHRDSRQASAFRIWAGPGVFLDGEEQTEGFIIEWKRGEPPPGTRGVEVSFHTGCDRGEIGCHSEEPGLAYVVTYAGRDGKEPGFVYLPGPRDEAAPINTSISMTRGHGYEGHWLRATAA